MDFLFHNLSEKEREEIRKQVDIILNSFSAKLSKIDKKDEKESFIERKKGILSDSSNTEGIVRKEFERSEGFQKDSSFSKEVMFKNAPEKNKDFIIAEKKKW